MGWDGMVCVCVSFFKSNCTRLLPLVDAVLVLIGAKQGNCSLNMIPSLLS